MSKTYYYLLIENGTGTCQWHYYVNEFPAHDIAHHGTTVAYFTY